MANIAALLLMLKRRVIVKGGVCMASIHVKAVKWTQNVADLLITFESGNKQQTVRTDIEGEAELMNFQIVGKLNINIDLSYELPLTTQIEETWEETGTPQEQLDDMPLQIVEYWES